MKWAHNFSLITIFLLGKMVIRKKSFVNFIQSGVIIDTNLSKSAIIWEIYKVKLIYQNITFWKVLSIGIYTSKC